MLNFPIVSSPVGLFSLQTYQRTLKVPLYDGFQRCGFPNFSTSNFKKRTQSSVTSLLGDSWFCFWNQTPSGLWSDCERTVSHSIHFFQVSSKWIAKTYYISGKLSQEGSFFQLNLVLKPRLKVHASNLDLNRLRIWCSKSSIIKEELSLRTLLSHTTQQLGQAELQLGVVRSRWGGIISEGA